MSTNGKGASFSRPFVFPRRPHKTKHGVPGSLGLVSCSLNNLADCSVAGENKLVSISPQKYGTDECHHGHSSTYNQETSIEAVAVNKITYRRCYSGPSSTTEVVNAFRPDLFEFDILDYSTSRGIDALCVLGTPHGGLQRGNLRYVEFKRALAHEFRDHTFERLAAIVCWECNLENGAKVCDFAGNERMLQITKTGKETIYMILAPQDLPSNNIKVYPLKDYLSEKLGISFKTRLSTVNER